MSKPLTELSDPELTQARDYLRKLVADTNQAIPKTGPGPGWDSVLERLDQAMTDYEAEIQRRTAT